MLRMHQVSHQTLFMAAAVDGIKKELNKKKLVVLIDTRIVAGRP